MNTTAPTRPTDLHACRVRLSPGPAAVAEARSQVRAAICAWRVPVDPDIAILLTSDLVTDALRHHAGGAIVLTVGRASGQLRVDVHGDPCSWPTQPTTDAATPPGLVLVAIASAAWGCYRTPAGTAAYFTLAFQPDLARSGGYGSL